jgi:phospholipase/carboxylesterase
MKTSRKQEPPLPAVELETRPNPSHSVIWLHGLGADGNDFVPVVGQLDLPPLGVRFVFPHAPMMAVTINGGFVMRAWYDILLDDIALKEDEAGIRRSQALVQGMIEREIERGIPTSRIVLAGFSQGGAIALHTGLRYVNKLAGLMALSAYLPLMKTVERERNPANNLTPIFMGHGTIDNIVPLSLAVSSRARLTQLGYQVELREYPMMHAVCPEELADIGAWLKTVLL